MESVISGGGGMDNIELPPIVIIGQPSKGSAYTNALVKRVVFSDPKLAEHWQARVAGLRELPVSQRSMPVFS